MEHGENDQAVNEELLADGSVTVDGAIAEFGIGKSVLYKEMSAGRLRYCMVGTRRIIPRKALRLLVAKGMVKA